MGDCPVCSLRFGALQELQSHVNAHFEAEEDDEEVQIVEPGPANAPKAASGPAAGGTARAEACPQCGAQLPAAELDSHLLAHQLEQDDLRQLQNGGNNGGGSNARQEAQDAAAAAALAAAEWGDGSWEGGGGGLDGSSDAELAAAHQAQLEDMYFQELRAKYGFVAAPRSGACRVCGEDGHWARECPQNPEVQQAAARVLNPPTVSAIVSTQRQAQPTAMHGGGTLLEQLAACLEAAAPRGPGPGGAADYSAALCGPVEHFASTLLSSGWGCGYNNMQMMAAHLLAARPDARQALFGGAGWVPDIPALQAWLEVAWRAGFDPEGAEQLERRVQGTHKWVGTTEAAALLRFFGLRARIADFGAPQRQQQQQQQQGGPAAAHAGGGSNGRGGMVPAHPNVECDVCGQVPIRGDRFKSLSRPNYDLCSACHAKPEAAAAGPFSRMMPSAMAAPQAAAAGGAGGGGSGGSVAEQLVQWVWRYFTSDEGGAAAAGSSGQAGGGAGGGGAAASAEAGPNPKRLRLVPPQQRQRVHLSGKSPLYFQHEGHSRTIVGVERRLVGKERRPAYTLLVLDPGTPGPRLADALHSRQGWQRLLKRGPHTLRQSQFQLLWVEPGLAAEGPERQALKRVVASERY